MNSTGGLTVQFFDGSLTPASNQIYARFKLINNGSGSITLANVKLRYYYTIDGSQQSQSFWCDWSQAGSANVTGTFGSVIPAKATADSYLEVGFTSGAGSLAPGAFIEVQSRNAKADWSNYNQSNDYSFNPAATAYVDWNYVTATVSGALVWGVAP